MDNKEWFENELYIFTVNTANVYLDKYLAIETLMKKKIRKGSYDKSQAIPFMGKYLKTVATDYIRRNGSQFGVDKTVISNNLIKNVAERLLDDIETN
jgi:hypothetical protein